MMSRPLDNAVADLELPDLLAAREELAAQPSWYRATLSTTDPDAPVLWLGMSIGEALVEIDARIEHVREGS
jgi:hypothetical protein